MKHQIYGEELKNMPYESRPQGCDSPIWRYSKNPIIKVNPFKGASRVFNSAVMAYQGEFIGVFRADTNTGIPYLFLGHSKDGVNFTFDEKPIVFHDKDGNPLKMEYGYDPRLTEIDGTYYIIFCTSNHGPTLGIGKTKDFKDFELPDIASTFQNKSRVNKYIPTSYKSEQELFDKYDKTANKVPKLTKTKSLW